MGGLVGRRTAASGVSGSRQGLFPQGCAPHSLFGLAQKENAPRPVEEKKALGRAPVQWPSARTGVGVSVQAPILPCRRARYALLRGCSCRPVADGAEVIGVVVALNCFSFRCRWPVVDGSWGNGPMRASAPTGTRKAFCLVWYKPLQPPGQRVAERNARKEEQIKCALAPRCRRHPRRGNPLSNPHRTPPRPSERHREHAGTISRRPPYSAEARRCRSATKSVLFFWTVHGPFSFRQDRKENGGCIAQLST